MGRSAWASGRPKTTTCPNPFCSDGKIEVDIGGGDTVAADCQDCLELCEVDAFEFDWRPISEFVYLELESSQTYSDLELSE